MPVTYDCTHDGPEKPCGRCVAKHSIWSGQCRCGPERQISVTIAGREYRLIESGAPPDQWGFWLWPSSVALAMEVATRQWAGLTVLELGAGLGLPGMVADRAGAGVTFGDKDTHARLDTNLTANGAEAVTLPADWAQLSGQWDSIIGSEFLLYRPAAELLPLISRLWGGKGPLLFTDQGGAQRLEQAMQAIWPAITRREVEGRMADGRVFCCDLYIVEPKGT